MVKMIQTLKYFHNKQDSSKWITKITKHYIKKKIGILKIRHPNKLAFRKQTLRLFFFLIFKSAKNKSHGNKNCITTNN